MGLKYKGEEYGWAVYDWMKEILKKGPLDCQAVRETARFHGFTKGEIHAARKALGVVTIRTNNIWQWKLPAKKK